MKQPLTKKLLLIGWDAADWKMIHPLMEAGKMPVLQGLVESGSSGNLASLDPPLSPIMWTSIATGKTADKHGVLGFTQPRADGSGVQPVLSSSRRVKAVWNILMQQGLKTHVIGWWPSHPAERLNGVTISNFYHHMRGPVNNPAPMPPGSVQPERVAEILEELRIHPQELTGSHIQPFVPNAESIDQAKDKCLSTVAKITAECATVHAAATWVMEHEEWDFMAVYYDAIDHYCHGFMRFHPPYREGINPELYQNYKEVVEGGYRLHDMMLRRLLELAGPDTTVIICSDHGFHPDHMRPLVLPKEPAGPAEEHRHYGMIAMSGPGIEKDKLIYGSSLLDVTPTILTLFGLPVAKDMDGKPLLDGLKTSTAPEMIESWEKVHGECGMLDPAQQGDPWAEQAAMEQLIALGYIDPPDENAEKAIASCQRETKYYLARVYLHKHAYEQALPLLQELFDDSPEQMRFGVRLANCLQMLGNIQEARRITDITIANWEQHAMEQYQQWIKEAEEKGETLPPEVRSLTLDDLRQSNRPGLDLLQGTLLLAEEKPEQALVYLQRAEQAMHQRPDLYQQLGQAYLKVKRHQDAEDAFFKALEIDPDSAHAYHGLAVVYLRMRRFREASEAAACSLGLLYHNPQAHYHLGMARFRLGDFAGSERSCLNAIKQAPGMKKAHELLVSLYQHYLNQPIKAQNHRRIIDRLIVQTDIADLPNSENSTPQRNAAPSVSPPAGRDDIDPNEVIAIVSGLPRSGTSMMMQLLEQGGVELLTDQIRQADENNPKGYYEYEPVKGLLKADGCEWIGQAKGKAVKVIAQLLPSLPSNYRYRIIFMQRELEEVLRSQQSMLAGEIKSSVDTEKLAQSYRDQMLRVKKFIETQQHMELLYLSYREVLDSPVQAAEAVSRFLGRTMDIEKAAKAVEPMLYRVRSEQDCEESASLLAENLQE
jgi:predicted AlkP superfamily phosphohydrolase/phosphomutase/tetratricopeptide (TPR) repeat protein